MDREALLSTGRRVRRVVLRVVLGLALLVLIVVAWNGYRLWQAWRAVDRFEFDVEASRDLLPALPDELADFAADPTPADATSGTVPDSVDDGEPALPPLSTENVLGLVYLGLIGGAITYVLFFRGIARLEPSAVSTLGFLSPVTAVMLGWLVLDQTFTTFQQLGLVAVFAGIWMAQRAARPATPPPAKLQESSVNAD